MKHHRSPFSVFACSLALLCFPLPSAFSGTYVATSPEAGFKLPTIVLPDALASGTDLGGKVASKSPAHPNKPVAEAVRYLQEAVRRMTGKELPVTVSNDLSRGIVLTLLREAPDDIKKDPKVIRALRQEEKDVYNAVEAFYVCSGPGRILLVANTPDGLRHAVVELLDSVGYEVLGMGPNWTHVPDYTTKPLSFDLEIAGRPGLYNRKLWATSGQDRGIGTLLEVFDPSDETVKESYLRWRIGRRIASGSIPEAGGHAMQRYHRAVSEKMRGDNTTDGFLASKTFLGKNAERPAATADVTDALWINVDGPGTPEEGKVFYSNGEKWAEQDPKEYRAGLDVTLPWVREIVLEDLKVRARAHFEKNTDATLVFGADPEDGTGYANFVKTRKNPNWYPEYLKQEGIPLGKPYKLNGMNGLKQPFELWDPSAPSDTVFGFANWLGREYNKWIDSLPEHERVTATGKDKKQLLTIGLLSYNYYDVPPNFNLDPRIRVQISAFPKHRGSGKWANFATGNDMAEAFSVLLPQQPLDVGWYLSAANFGDQEPASIQKGSPLPEAIQQKVAEAYRLGFRGIGAEMDFNFGRLGMAYYLYSKMLWNPQLSADELTKTRDRWLQRAYGEGWQEMRSYYELMSPARFINGPNTWAKAIRFIAAADAKVDPTKEPAVQSRLDDLKQYWYFYYLLDVGETKPASPAFKEFVWKGQMSYMTAMHMVVRRFFDTKKVATAIGEEFRQGRAHYTSEETNIWWQKVLDHWQVTPVSEFQQAMLADGMRGSSVDLNDLVPVAEFESDLSNEPFIYSRNSDMNFWTFATEPGQEIGFKLFWPWVPENRTLRDMVVSYGMSRWNSQKNEWEPVVDETMTSIHSRAVPGPGGKDYQLVEARYSVAMPGTYRISLGAGSYASQLTSLDYDLPSETYTGENRGFTFSDNFTGHTQNPVFVYVPKGTKSVDLEVWDSNGKKEVTFYSGLPSSGLIKERTVDIGKSGTHVIELKPGEDGSLISISGGGFYFPFLYSIPQLWSKSPASLLVPRGIANADGLTIIK